MKTDIVIAGCGVSGLFCALNLPKDKNITVITKTSMEESDSFLAQGGICVQHDDADYDAFFEDTLKAGRYENKHESVDIMIRSSRDVIKELVSFGVEFEQDNNGFKYTREGAHSRPRILYSKDQTGREITSKLLARAKERRNITILEHTTAVDILLSDDVCAGLFCFDEKGDVLTIEADYTVLATGGIGGLFTHSTNFPHLTGDALAIALRHNLPLKNIDYIQIHPTTLYTQKKGRKFLISESVRGEGAVLLNAEGKRFVDELLPRDVVSQAIFRQMETEGSDHVWLSLQPIPKSEIAEHFPNICEKCLEEGYDVMREPIPVVPSQHYFMGGVDVNSQSMTSMCRLYAVGETACNGVHGKNRLASNSLLESLVFAKRAANDITANYIPLNGNVTVPDKNQYTDWAEKYKKSVLDAIEKEKNNHE